MVLVSSSSELDSHAGDPVVQTGELAFKNKRCSSSRWFENRFHALG